MGSVGSFCPKCVFGCQEHVQKISEGGDAWLRFVTRNSFDDSSKLGFNAMDSPIGGMVLPHLFNGKNHLDQLNGLWTS